MPLYRFSIPELFAATGLSNYKLARTLGKTETQVIRLRDPARKRLDIETVNELCTFFRCKPGDLYVVVEEKPARKRSRKK